MRFTHFAIIVLLVILGGAALSAGGVQTDWPVYGHDQGGRRYSPLARINTKNVTQLRRAWIYHMSEDVSSSARPSGPPDEVPEYPSAATRRSRLRPSQATPIVIGNVMYLPTPYSRVVALEPETGKVIWKYELRKSTPSTRGVAYWPGDQQTPPRILFGTSAGRLMAIEAKTGRPAPDFGHEGEVDLRPGVADNFPNELYGVESPPVIYRDLAIVGSIVQESPGKGPRGDVRAFNVRTGKLVWTFHTVPQPGEPGHDTWEGDSWKDRSGANVWGFMTVDEARGMVFLPLGSPSYDFYGADRKGKNLYGNCLVALDAATGKLLWHYQFTHHDIWDYDPAAPPALVDVTRDGQQIPAVVQVTKMSLVFILDRRNGKPVYGVEERPVPQSDVPGEVTWPTQPFPLKPAPLARISFKREEIATVTAEHKSYCTELFDQDGGLHNDGLYTPYGVKPTVVFPGTLGGANWGGVSFDPKLGYIFVNTQDLGSIGQMARQAEGARVPWARGSRLGPYGRFWNPRTNWPCQQPPWGELHAVNVNTGEIVWQTPLGIVEELAAKGIKNTGTPNLGGSIVTAGGLVFIAATNDSRFRAFDSRTGKELWVTKLDASGYATPITYLGRDGKQYVVITATGGSRLSPRNSADTVIAFSLR